MILLIISIIFLVGSVAATDTASNDTSIIQQDTSLNEVSDNSVSNSVNTMTTNSNTNTISTNTTTSTKSSKSSLNSTNTKTLKTSSNTKYTTKTNVASITQYAGKTVRIKSVIKTSTGAYVKSGKVVFKINGKTIGKTSVSNGGAAIKYTIPSTFHDSKYTITVVYGGSSVYKSSTGTGYLYIKNSTKTNIAVKTTSTYAGKSTKILAVIKTSTGAYVKSGKVVFKINGKTIGKASVSNGGAAIKYTIPSSYHDSKYTITVVYGGSGIYKSSTKTGYLYIKNSTKTKVTVKTVNAVAGKSTKIQAVIKTSTGAYVKSGKAVFKINGKTIGKASVSNGKATIKYTIPSSYHDSKYTITVVYGENGIYKSSKGSAKLVISNPIPKGYEKYLKATSHCQVSSSYIQKIAKKFNSSYSSTYSKAVAIFNYLNARLSYSYYYNTRYGAIKTISRKCGNCVDMAHSIIAVARASGIPARYCHAVCHFRSGLVVGHVWAELYVNSKWYKCDLTSNSNSFGKIVNWRSSSSVRRYISLSF